MVGLPAFFRAETSLTHVIVQIAGDALRMRADTLRGRGPAEGPFRRSLDHLSERIPVQVSHGVACNGLHTVQQRCCRWLLMTHDRVQRRCVPADPRVTGDDARRAAGEHLGSPPTPPGAGLDPEPARQDRHPRSRRIGGLLLRMLPIGQRTVHPAARLTPSDLVRSARWSPQGRRRDGDTHAEPASPYRKDFPRDMPIHSAYDSHSMPLGSGGDRADPGRGGDVRQVRSGSRRLQPETVLPRSVLSCDGAEFQCPSCPARKCPHCSVTRVS